MVLIVSNRVRTSISLVVVGHVDAGKSTINGHLLCLLGSIDQVPPLQTTALCCHGRPILPSDALSCQRTSYPANRRPILSEEVGGSYERGNPVEPDERTPPLPPQLYRSGPSSAFSPSITGVLRS